MPNDLTPKLRFPEFKGNWKIYKIKNLFQLISGQHLNPDQYTSEFENEKPYFTGPSDFTNNTHELKKWALIEGKDARSNDILFTVKGSGVGTIMMLKLPKVVIGRQLMAIRSEKGSASLLFFFLETQKHLYESLAKGNMIPGLSRSDILETKLNFPSLPEQTKIAKFLSAVDEKIKTLTKKKTLLEEYKKGVMQQLFSQEIRFKDEQRQDFPDWEEKTLGEVAENIMYGMNSAAVEYDGIHKYLRITDIDENSRQFIPNPLTSPDGNKEEKYRLKEGDIVFTRTGASVGKSYLYNSKDGNLFFAGFLIKFSIKNNDPYFIYCQTLLESYSKWVGAMSMRSGQPGINAEEYKSFVVFLPSLLEQQKIANFLTALDEKITKATQQIETAQAFKKGLLQKMFV